jgi:hypothetical protein
MRQKEFHDSIVSQENHDILGEYESHAFEKKGTDDFFLFFIPFG